MKVSFSRLRKTLIFSLIIAISCNAIFITGCTKKKSIREIETIDIGTPWYSYTDIVYDSFSNNDSIMPVLLTPEYKLFIQYYDSQEEDSCNRLEVFSGLDLNPVEIDLDELCVNEWDYVNVQSGFVYENDCYVAISIDNQGSIENIIYKIDISSSSLIEEQTIAFDGEYSDNATIGKVMAKDDKMIIEFYYFTNVVLEYGFKVISFNGNSLGEYTMNNQVNCWTLDNADNIVCISSGQGGTEVDIVSISTGSVTQMASADTIIDKFGNGVMMNDGCIYSVPDATTTICKYDFNTNEESVVFDFNNCNVNMSSLLDNTLFYCDQENIIFIKSTFYSGEYVIDNTLIELHKEDNNPNVGKSILIAAPCWNLSFIEGEGIKQFNSTSEEYYFYVTLDNSYSSIPVPDDIETIEEYRAFEYQNEVTRIDNLIQDISTGTGPDILLDFGKYPVLDSSDYTINLKDLISEDVYNSELYFSNIIDSFILNDALYQIPLSVTVAGIYANSENFNDDQLGFTYEQYSENIDSFWEGVDPIGSDLGREMYFRNAINYIYENTHNNEGLIELNNDSFRRACEYSYSVPKDRISVSSRYAKYLEFSNIAYDLERMAVKKEGFALYGLPSVDATGPMAIINESIAITTCTFSQDASIELVNLMLSYDIQKTNKRYNPINIAAFEEYANNGLEYGNAMIERNMGYEDYYSTDIINVYIDILRRARIGGLTDSISMLIINEEMQAYYAGQKSLDDIINIIENRTNNMLNERHY